MASPPGQRAAWLARNVGGGLLSIVFVPLFAWACIEAIRRSRPVFLLYAAPALVMLGLHAVLANHYVRYNLILIGPFSAGAAWIIAQKAASVARNRGARSNKAAVNRRGKA